MRVPASHSASQTALKFKLQKQIFPLEEKSDFESEFLRVSLCPVVCFGFSCGLSCLQCVSGSCVCVCVLFGSLFTEQTQTVLHAVEFILELADFPSFLSQKSEFSGVFTLRRLFSTSSHLQREKETSCVLLCVSEAAVLRIWMFSVQLAGFLLFGLNLQLKLQTVSLNLQVLCLFSDKVRVLLLDWSVGVVLAPWCHVGFAPVSFLSNVSLYLCSDLRSGCGG